MAVTIGYGRNAAGDTVHIMEVDAGGLACGCRCLQCDHPLEAVNPFNPAPVVEPHFRHHRGDGEYRDCELRSFRAGLHRIALVLRDIEAPERKQHHSQVWGNYRVAGTASAAGETLRIASFDQINDTGYWVTLDNGRQLVILLDSVANVDAPQHMAILSSSVDSARVSQMVPTEAIEVISRAPSVWVRHWLDGDLLADAEQDSIRQVEQLKGTITAPPAHDPGKRILLWRRRHSGGRSAFQVLRDQTLSDLQAHGYEVGALLDEAWAACAPGSQANQWMHAAMGRHQGLPARVLMDALIRAGLVW